MSDAETCEIEGTSQANKGWQQAFRLGYAKCKYSNMEKPNSIKEWEQEDSWWEYSLKQP